MLRDRAGDRGHRRPGRGGGRRDRFLTIVEALGHLVLPSGVWESFEEVHAGVIEVVVDMLRRG
jgi:hypothetical protein